jgi:transposase, IS30 family
MAKKVYNNLQYEDRCKIEVLKESKLSNTKIAQQLKVHRSSIGRELKRNSLKGKYHCQEAQKKAESRRKKASKKAKKMNAEMIQHINNHLIIDQWSPEQISGRMKKNELNTVSHERIYQHVWQDKSEGGFLYKFLRHHGKKYNKRSGKNAGRGLIPHRVDISQRPAIVEEKSRIGDWETDTIIGKNHKGAIVSMVDRASKYTKLKLVPSKHANIVADAIIDKLSPIKQFVKTLTMDNGKEFSDHQRITANLDAQVYFATPYHSWERGLNEHTNGLVRQYLPKNTPFDIITEEEVQKIEDLLNSRPRKVLNFMSPLEVFTRCTFVALQS